MSETETPQRIDLTAPSDGLTYAEILTPAGIVRVSANLVNWRTNQPVVVVEVERQVPARPNTAYQGTRAVPAGEWEVEVREQFGGLRTDVTLTRKEEQQR